MTLKPLREQVVVIVGGSSGIGLATANRAARRGASVAIIARNEHALSSAADAIRRDGGRALPLVADVSDPAGLETVAEQVLREYGRIDTWVNGAAVAAYSRLCSSPVEEMRRQFDVTYWGQVYGSRVAVDAMRSSGGALVNIGSGLSDRAIMLLGTYCAAKHAIKAFTDTLRLELSKDRVPISVTLVKPSSINTPFYQKALTRLGVEPRPIPPVYAPDVVAEAILTAAQRPVREVSVGSGAALMSVARFTPWLTDMVLERVLFNAHKSDIPADETRPHNVYAPLADDGGERGAWNGLTLESSAHTSLMLHKWTALAAAMTAVVVASTAMTKAR
jgi:NAD(P)-dependent dehydrogenase (short-subunit alcohol dehydrogenase family)